MQKIVRFLYVAAAFISVGLGAIGIVLPILPTTPFLLLAAILFAKGSEHFHNWFFLFTSLVCKGIHCSVSLYLYFSSC